MHRERARRPGRLAAAAAAVTAAACAGLLLSGCAALTPGRDLPAEVPATPVRPANPALVQPFAATARIRPGQSGVRLYSVGVDGLLLRLELIAQAQRSLDLQYYIFHGDESGRLVTEALSKAASRGVRVRILVDDAETEPGDEQLFALTSHANVAIRVFNPWRYRGHNRVLRGLEFVFNRSRLDYRMHNKLMVVDGALAIIGGRNIGDQYFQVDPESQYADDDLLVTGAAVPPLAALFEQFWNSEQAVSALSFSRGTGLDPAHRVTVPVLADKAGFNFPQQLAAGEPLGEVLSGGAPLTWADTELACDSPDKKAVLEGHRAGRLAFGPVAAAIRATRSGLALVNPYVVPTAGELRLLAERHAAGRRVRLLTTSLEASMDPLAQAGYSRYRVPLLEAGVELYEMRARPGTRRGSGEATWLTHTGNYSLHAKLMVFDLSAVFVGSMNLDQRSRWLNTEDGLIVYSPELAAQTVNRFDAMAAPQNAYRVTLEPATGSADPRVTWTTTRKDGTRVTLHREPARSLWERIEVWVLRRLPIEHEL